MSEPEAEPTDRLLTAAEVAKIFRVNPATTSRWAARGRITRIRTPGGQNRFRESEIRRLLEEEPGGE